MSGTRPRIFVTGLGAVTGFGAGVAALARGLRRGAPAISPVTTFDPGAHRTQLAGMAPLPPQREGDPAARLGRGERFAVQAAEEAIVHAGLGAAELTAAGVFFGSSNGGLLEGEAFFRRLRRRERRLGLRQVASHQNNGPGDAVARRFQCTGPVLTCSSACTSANMALAAALDALRAGECEVALAGGADALSEVTYAGFNALRAVDPGPSRPFRVDRAGLSMGEGAGVLLLETEAHARARGAVVLAELAGAGATCDAHHMSAPKDDALGPLHAMQRALDDAGESPSSVAFVNAHGTGTPHNDVVEARALRELFGERVADVPVTSTKSLVGHLLGACGGLEAVVCVLGLLYREVHPTGGDDPADPELGLDVVIGGVRRLAGARVALSNNLAFGGNNVTVVFRRAPHD
ncbi:MAG TPA: beta-ketoacyl-[acyl-carrier-protein] synthase family protein [Planctomycetota bacterium]|nr:beta-ketoacyl-[acyl-carrier-protein] synthase family protein [Planctomycetota bacterium]